MIRQKVSEKYYQQFTGLRDALSEKGYVCSKADTAYREDGVIVNSYFYTVQSSNILPGIVLVALTDKELNMLDVRIYQEMSIELFKEC